MKMLRINDKAPDFFLKDANGNLIRLLDYKNKIVVLYFYPRDNTPGCTKEACNIRDNMRLLNKKGVVVFGVSTDNEESHKKFSENFELNFPLLCDIDKIASKKYGVYAKKSLYGKEYFGIKRTTFIIKE